MQHLLCNALEARLLCRQMLLRHLLTPVRKTPEELLQAALSDLQEHWAGNGRSRKESRPSLHAPPWLNGITCPPCPPCPTQPHDGAGRA